MIALSCACTFDAPHAFDISGFKSGMSAEDAQILADKRGWQMEADPGGQSGDFRLAEPGGKGGDIIQFCDGRLFAMSIKVPDGFNGLVALIDDLTDAYGNPLVSTISSPEGFEPAIAQLDLGWSIAGGESRTITYGAAADDLSSEGIELIPSANYLLEDAKAICGDPSPRPLRVN